MLTYVCSHVSSLNRLWASCPKNTTPTYSMENTNNVWNKTQNRECEDIDSWQMDPLVQEVQICTSVKVLGKYLTGWGNTEAD